MMHRTTHAPKSFPKRQHCCWCGKPLSKEEYWRKNDLCKICKKDGKIRKKFKAIRMWIR
jgi:predicted nucleic acid-binding Zn ribbon protein